MALQVAERNQTYFCVMEDPLFEQCNAVTDACRYLIQTSVRDLIMAGIYRRAACRSNAIQVL